MAEVEAKEALEKQDFLACTRHGRRNAFSKIVCKCQVGNPDATEHAKDCPIVANEIREEAKNDAEKTVDEK